VALTVPELRRFVTALSATPERWRHHVRHEDVRVYEQIWDAEGLNAWVICWSENHDTGFHDHDASAAAVAVVQGTVREHRLAVGSAARATEFRAGETFTVPGYEIHRVCHAGVGPAVTIHAYSPPLARTGAYRIGLDGALERETRPYQVELRAEPALR
jgi:hypothetical protein